jgi:hypothetical protein
VFANIRNIVVLLLRHVFALELQIACERIYTDARKKVRVALSKGRLEIIPHFLRFTCKCEGALSRLF